MLSIYNKISDYIMVLNYNGEIIFCNQSFLNLLNYTHEEVLNLSIKELIKNEYILKESEEINKTLEFYTKSKKLVKVNSMISTEKFNGNKNIFIVGKQVKSKPYTMEMLEDILDNINASMFIIDNDDKYLYVNKAFSNMVNKKREDIIGTYSIDHWSNHIYNEFKKNNNEIIKNKSPKIFNEKIEDVNGVSWYESYKAPIIDDNGKFKYIVAQTKNINLSKTISEELYKNYNKVNFENDFASSDNNCNSLNKILSNIGEKIIDYTDADGISILLYDNEKEGLIPTIKLSDSEMYLEKVGFIPLKKDEVDLKKYKGQVNCILPKNKIADLYTKDYIKTEQLNYCGSYAIELYNEFIGIIALTYSNGNSPKFNSDEYMKYICNKLAMIIKNTQLSYEVYSENRKRKYTEKELEQYLNISVDLIGIIDKNGYLKRVSPNWYNVLGWTEEELLSMPITNLIHPDELDLFKRDTTLYKVDGQIARNIIRYRHKNGNYLYLEWSSEYLSDEDVYITTATDITNKLEIEKEKRILEEAIKLETVKNEFFSNISHEFRTPINIILGTMQVINKNIEQNNIQLDSLKKYTHYIKQNSYRLLRLVNNLIDISKMDIGAYELRCSNQNIINIIEDITMSVADYTKNHNINLIFDTDSEEIITYCDPDKIERIMLNLLSNAIKYTKENGFIKVDIKSIKNEIIVSIKDSGIGIPKDKLDIIFDRFGQVDGSLNRKCEGSGIGLSLVKNLIEMHGGKINVRSEVNKGSEFIFSIPIKLSEKNNDKEYNDDRKCKHVERCDIEFSDIYSM